MIQRISVLCLSLILLSTVSSVIADTYDFETHDSYTYGFAGGFDRVRCLERTLQLIGNGTLASNDESFYRDNLGRSMTHRENLTLTLPGCQKICGKQEWYWDIGPRLSVWLLPILLLLSNVELSPLDKRRFLALIHLLGDPLDSIWSLVDKIDSVDRCYHIAKRCTGICERCKRVVGTVLAGFEELEGPRFRSQHCLDTVADESTIITHLREWRQTAVDLADSRTDEFLRTWLAILLCIYQLIAGFVKEVGGGNSSHPGGRIATALFLSWLVPTVLLSNTIGGFTSRRTCYRILRHFAERMDKPLHIRDSESVFLPGFSSLARSSSTDYFQSLSWSGAIYSFRPWKTQYVRPERNWGKATLVFILSISPICIGMTGGFILLWFTVPNGFNCRHLWLIGIFLVWLASSFITWLISTLRLATGKYHWHCILAKDALIAVASLLVIFLSACGLFNSCYCWSGFMYYGDDAHVLLNTDPIYEHNVRTIYPIVVGVCMLLQFLLFGTITIIWRRGLKLLRWSEGARREEWERGEGCLGCERLSPRQVELSIVRPK